MAQNWQKTTQKNMKTKKNSEHVFKAGNKNYKEYNNEKKSKVLLVGDFLRTY